MSKTIPYGLSQTVPNYLLTDIQNLVTTKLAVDVMSNVEEKACNKPAHTQMVKDFRYPFLYDDVPSMLLIRQDTNLEAVLDIAELKAYKWILGMFCRGSMFESKEIHEATFKKHKK